MIVLSPKAQRFAEAAVRAAAQLRVPGRPSQMLQAWQLGLDQAGPAHRGAIRKAAAIVYLDSIERVSPLLETAWQEADASELGNDIALLQAIRDDLAAALHRQPVSAVL